MNRDRVEGKHSDKVVADSGRRELIIPNIPLKQRSCALHVINLKEHFMEVPH